MNKLAILIILGINSGSKLLEGVSVANEILTWSSTDESFTSLNEHPRRKL
jgi:hypothetical protein